MTCLKTAIWKARESDMAGIEPAFAMTPRLCDFATRKADAPPSGGRDASRTASIIRRRARSHGRSPCDGLSAIPVQTVPRTGREYLQVSHGQGVPCFDVTRVMESIDRLGEDSHSFLLVGVQRDGGLRDLLRCSNTGNRFFRFLFGPQGLSCPFALSRVLAP